MSKSTAIKSGISIGKKAGHAATKSRVSANVKFVIGAGAVILVIGGLIIAAMPEQGATRSAESRSAASASSARSAGALSALETNYKFGTVSMAAGKVTHRYWIRNTGTEPILIRKMYTSCMCTTAALVKGGRKFDAYGMPGHTPIPTMNEPMAPNEDAMVEVIFDPAAHGPAGIGLIDRVVTIENNAGRPLELAFTANVTP